jgi:hypothetical protein
MFFFVVAEYEGEWLRMSLLRNSLPEFASPRDAASSYQQRAIQKMCFSVTLVKDTPLMYLLESDMVIYRVIAI